MRRPSRGAAGAEFGDAMVVAIALWSAVHGVAALWVNTPGLAVDLAHEVAGQQRALLAGLAP